MESFKTINRKMILLSNFTAMAIVLGLIESSIGLISVPGAKLGLANLVSIIILFMFSYKEALLVTITRIFLVALLSGNFGPTFWMGLSGGILSVSFMSLFKTLNFGTTLVSLIGSITHQVGQIIVGMYILGASEIAMYLYIMIPLGVITGLIIGLIAEKFLIHYKQKEDNMK